MKESFKIEYFDLHDLKKIAEVEQTLTKESEDLERSVNKMKMEQYEPLHGR